MYSALQDIGREWFPLLLFVLLNVLTHLGKVLLAAFDGGLRLVGV